MTISLLPRQALLKTGDVDHAAWNYDGLLGYVSRRRFALVRSLLPERRTGKLLEVGYGSGVFFPELAKHADQLYGADIHQQTAEVTAVLAKAGIHAQLVTASAEALPFPDAHLRCDRRREHFRVLSRRQAAPSTSLARVLGPRRPVIVVTPGHSPLLGLGTADLHRRIGRQRFR